MKDLLSTLFFLTTVLINSSKPVLSFPTPLSNTDSLQSKKEQRSNPNLISSRSPGSISIPLKRSRKKKIIKREDSPGEDELYDGGPDYEYQGTVGFGTPPQEFEIQFDTGSSILMCLGSEFLAQKGLSSVGIERGPAFNSANSSTYAKVGNGSNFPPFRITYAYGDTTQFTADIVQDTVIIGGYVLENAPWAEAVSGNFSTPGNDVSGILGLAFTSENVDLGPEASFTVPPVELLWQLGALQEPVFSFALVTNEGVLGLTSEDESIGGVFTLGRTDSSLYTGEISYVPLVLNSDYSSTYPSSWTSTITSFTSNGNVIQGSAMDVLFDTGSAVSSLPPDLITNIFASIDTSKHKVVVDTDGVPYVQCEPGSPDPINLSIQFGGATFVWPFENLIAGRVKAKDGTTLCAFGPMATSPDSQGYSIIVGADFLKSVFSIFRFYPPSIGLANLSSTITSQTPSNTGAFTQILETTNLGAGIEVETTVMGIHTTELQVIASQSSDVVQPTTQPLPLTPSFAGTTSLSPLAVATYTGKGSSAAASARAGTGRGWQILVALGVAALFVL